MSQPNKFLFLGNGSYNNHGCEAIVCGSMAILKNAFGEQIVAANGVAERAPVVEYQERYSARQHVESFSIFENPSFLDRCRKKVMKYGSDAEFRSAESVITPHLRNTKAMLALGGDNFSLEYGIPYTFLGWNAMARDAGLPVFIWGASIGPFSNNKKFEAQFVRHAKTLTKIFVRETETLNYLTRLGLEDKLRLAADPAFAMEPEKPPQEAESLEGAIGINLSPLMAQFVTAGNKDAWKEMAVQIVLSVARSTDRPIALIPHVNASEATRSCDPGWYYKDDYGFLSEVKSDPRLANLHLMLLSNNLSAPQLKYEISRLWAFAGARTHATIAAFSMGIPCISIAYSVKAQGLNKDIFGTTDYCIPPSQISPSRLVEAFNLLDNTRADIVRRYESVIPQMKKSAFGAGEILKAEIAGHYGK